MCICKYEETSRINVYVSVEYEVRKGKGEPDTFSSENTKEAAKFNVPIQQTSLSTVYSYVKGKPGKVKWQKIG
jgi:hypothetical protein